MTFQAPASPAATRGRFITLEGVDGAGKSTHVAWLADELRALGVEVVETREPGGTPLAERLREMVLNTPMRLETETLLMFAARSEHIAEVIEPALAAGRWVLSDRFTDATYAYQGGGRSLGGARVEALEQWLHAGLQPDRTWLFDVPLEVARARLGRARTPDRFEQESDAFFARTREAYLARAAQSPDRIRIVDATRDIDAIRADLREQLRAWVAQ